MRWGRVALFLTAGAGALGCPACQDRDPEALVEPRQGKSDAPPGKDKEALGEPIRLLEYYVYRDAGHNYVHLVATGQFPRVNLNVVQDFFFNGIRDNDAIFYEYTDFSPYPVGPEDFPGDAGGAWEEQADGSWHVDIPWSGGTHYHDYRDPNNPVEIPTTFPDNPSFTLDGTADPFTFDIRFQTEIGDFLEYFRPRGIVLNGEETGEVSLPGTESSHHTVPAIYSYAAVESSRAGRSVYIDRIQLDPSSFTCEVKTIRERIDGENVVRTVAQINGTAVVALAPFDAQTDSVPEGWLHVMLALSSADPYAPESFLESFTATNDAQLWSAGAALTATLDPVPDGPFQLRLVVPYVYATDLEKGEVYTPAMNANEVGQGWTTVNPSAISVPGIWPLVVTDPFTVDCGR